LKSLSDSRTQHTAAYVSIRQHTSAYVSIRQHTEKTMNRSTTTEPRQCFPGLVQKYEYCVYWYKSTNTDVC
jgi:hypothetical protein